MYRSLFASVAILSFIILITGCTGTQAPTATPTPIPSPTHSQATPTITATPAPSPKPSTPTSGIIKGTIIYNPFSAHNIGYEATITDYMGTRAYKWIDSSIETDTYNGKSAYRWEVNEYGNVHNLANKVDYYYDKNYEMLGGTWQSESGTTRDFSPAEAGIYLEVIEPRNYDYHYDGKESVTVQGFTYEDAAKYVAEKTPYDSVTIWMDSSMSIPVKIEYAYSNVRKTYELTDMS